MIRSFHEPASPEPQLVIEEVNNADETARARAQVDRFQRNSEWLKSHWQDLLPHARGQFIAVAGQEAFIGSTAEEAWAKARAAHPDDDGAFSQYILPAPGSRIYANLWRVVAV